MTWTKICEKHRDSESIYEFADFVCKKINIWGGTEFVTMLNMDIKDIWGYLICFAETRGYRLSLFGYLKKWTYSIFTNNLERVTVKHCNSSEQAMIWCAKKFFEVVK